MRGALRPLPPYAYMVYWLINKQRNHFTTDYN
jgi:hypothetical protein